MTDDFAPACVICYSTLHADEQGRYACHRCTQRIDGDLLALPGLYSQLGGELAPSSSAGGPVVSGSRVAPPPLKLAVLNLMTEHGPVLAPLETWVRDWETYGHADMSEAGTLQQRVKHAVATLRFNLEWAATAHPGVDEFAREIGKARRDCEGQITAERQARPLRAVCPCGGILRFTLRTVQDRCATCGADYSHRALVELASREGRVAA